MAKPVRVAVIMDDASFVTGAARVDAAAKGMGDTLVSTSTKVNTSNEDMAAIAKKTSDAQVAAMLRVREASKLRIANLSSTIAAGAGAAPGTRQAEEAAAAQVLLGRENAKLARSYGEVTGASRGFSSATKTAELDLNKIARGGLAGSGALSSLGRSLAFASSGFIAFAVGATIIKGSIKAAQDEAVAQKQVAAQLKTSGKSWQQYGGQISDVLLKESHLAGFTKADLLQSFGYLVRIGGNVQRSLHLTALAADVARARSLSLSSASIALAKALGGSATALRRLGIIVPKHVSNLQALAFVQQKFTGQALAGTTASEKFHATLVDTGAVIGKALLPTFNRLATSLSNWLAKMNETGRLQKDVNSAVHDAGAVFHDLGRAIHYVDDVTGNFKNTVELLLALRFASILSGWIGSLGKLATAWQGVGVAAKEATLLETTAAGGAGIAGAAGGAAAGSSIASRIFPYTIAGTVAAASARDAAGAARFAQAGAGLGGLAASGFSVGGAGKETQGGVGVSDKGFTYVTFNGRRYYTGAFVGIAGEPVVLQSLRKFGGSGIPSAFNFFGRRGSGAGAAGGGPFGTAQPISIFKSFTDSIANQLAQARAALTTSTKDDVAAAKAQIAFIKKEIASGHLAGQSLIQALGAEAQAVGVIQSAEAAAAQKRAAQAAKRAAAAQKAQAKIQAAIENSIDPLNLQVRFARDQANNNKKDSLRTLRLLRDAARKAIASGKLNLNQQLEAYNQIAQLNQQIADATKKATKSGLGGFKQLNIHKLSSDLGLTAAQRKALEARLSQVGPHNTVPGSGTGAYGYRIGANDRPIDVHAPVYIDGRKVAENTTRHQQRHRRRQSSQRRGPHAGG